MDSADTPDETARGTRTRFRVAVLGGTGFIGVALGRSLIDRGHRVVAVARHANPVPPGAELRTVDLAGADIGEIATAIRDCDVVVNAAGGMWGLDESQLVAANVGIVERVIEAMCSLPHRPRLIHLGTVHEYGVVPIGTSLSETSPEHPVTRYGELKLRCTQAVVRAAEQGRLDGVVLRVSNAVGAGQPRTSLLGVVADQLRKADGAGEAVELRLGPLGSLRDFVGLTDAINAIIAAMSVTGLSGRVVNVGRGVAASAREMVELLLEVSGVPARLVEAERTGPAEDTWQQMDIRLASELLGWSPVVGLDEETKELWEHCAAYAGS